MPTPDTSPKAVARELRFLASYLPASIMQNTAYHRAHDLADALDAAPAVTWEERVRRAVPAYSLALVDLPWGSEAEFSAHKKALTAALCAAFPELAPSDD